jgi:hypothetical protein
MKMLIVIALAATSLPFVATAAAAPDGAPRERSVCTQLTLRAGSHLSGRRICRTPTQWREALGPDWRQRLAGASGAQDEYEAMQTRSPSSYDGSGGVTPQQSRGGPDAGGIPH